MAAILLVDDVKVERETFRHILESGGFQVVEAENAAEACRVFEQRASEIGLLVTDVRMPVTDGSMLANRLIAQRPGLPVLFISGVVDGSLYQELEGHLGQSAFLAKPFTAEVLLDAVGRLLAAAPGA